MKKLLIYKNVIYDPKKQRIIETDEEIVIIVEGIFEDVEIENIGG